MDRRFFIAAAVLGFLSVALGAFGAHALQKAWAALPDGAARLVWWDKAVHYHQIHAVLLVALAAWSAPAGRAASRRTKACVAAIAGVVLFSGSLYVMALTGVRALGAVTPLGGLAFLAAWAIAAAAALAPQGAPQET